MNHAAKKGFTLVELLLALSFVSILLLAVAMTIIQIGVSYNRGVTVKETNQAARGIAEDLRYAISSAQSFEVDDTTFLSVESGGVVLGGRLCLGDYSYVWNYGRAQAAPDRTLFERAPQGGTQEVYLVKVVDESRAYCATDTNTGGPALPLIREVDTAQAKELLKAGDRVLRLQQFTISTSDRLTDSLTGQRLYRVSFTIGAGNISAMTSDQSRCLLPSDEGASLLADLQYCVVQKFDIVVRAGNRGN